MHVDPARLFLWSGLLWHGALRAYWVSLVVRITVDLGLPTLELVLMGTAMEAALFVAEIPTGVVADTISRKWSVVIGFVLVGLSNIGAGLVESYPLLVATQLVWGVAYTFRSGADTAWVTDELGGADKVEQLLLRRGRLQLVVSIFAILAGGVLARLTSLTTSIVLTGVILIATGIALAVVMPETAFRPRRRDPSSPGRWSSLRATLAEGARITIRHRSLRLLVAVLVLAGLASEAVDRLDIRRLDDLGLSADLDEIVVVAVIAASEAALGAVVLWWSQRHLGGSRVAPGMAMLLAGSALGIAALGLIAVLPIAVVGLVLQGGLRSAAQPLQLTWANAHAESQVRATVHSFVEQANSVGEIGGGVLLGTLAALTTVPTAMTVSVLLILIAAALAAGGRRTWSSPAVVL